MNVAVLPKACATLCTAYFMICTSSALLRQRVELGANLALSGGRNFMVMHFCHNAKLFDRKAHG